MPAFVRGGQVESFLADAATLKRLVEAI